MDVLVALAISIGILIAGWTYVALGVAALPVWAGIVAWGCFFAAGGKTAGLSKTIAANLSGVFWAFLALSAWKSFGGGVPVLSVLVGVAALFPGWTGVWAIFLTSFFMSLMFPTIFALGLKDLGANTKLGGSLIVMAIIGGAVFTPLMGLVFELTRSMARAMLVPLACYAFIAYFAWIGSAVRRPARIATSSLA